MDFDAVLNGYVNDLNAAVKSREFPPFVMKWFDVSDCKFHVRSEENGKEETTHGERVQQVIALLTGAS